MYFYLFQMPRASVIHPHKTRSKSKRAAVPIQAAGEASAEGSSGDTPVRGSSKRGRATSGGKVAPKRARSHKGSNAQDVAEVDQLSAMLGLDKDPNFDVQEAFGSLLNAQEILGASADSLAEEAEGEMSFRRAYERLHRPTPSVSGSLGAAGLSAEDYSRPSDPLALGAAVEARIKLRIVKGLYVPLEVLWASNKGLSVNQYLRNPFLSPDNDPKLRALFPALTIERWTDAFLIYMHFYCMRYPDQRPFMHRYLYMIRSMEQSAIPGAWIGYDREFRVMRQADPSLPWHVLHPQLYLSHIASMSSFSAHTSQFMPMREFSSPARLMQGEAGVSGGGSCSTLLGP